jgi:hypothetical protein
MESPFVSTSDISLIDKENSAEYALTTMAGYEPSTETDTWDGLFAHEGPK